MNAISHSPAPTHGPSRTRLTDIRGQFADYREFHRSPGNKWTHNIGIPLIVVGFIWFFLQLPLVPLGQGAWITLAEPAIIALVVFYLALNVPLGIAMAIFFGALYAVGVAIDSVWLAVALFVGGWILQFVGHAVFEHRAPAFTKNAVHLLIGPAWIVNNWLNAIGIYPVGKGRPFEAEGAIGTGPHDLPKDEQPPTAEKPRESAA